MAPDDDETARLERTQVGGVFTQEAARRPVRGDIARSAHRERVSAAARRVMEAHADALDRLGR